MYRNGKKSINHFENTFNIKFKDAFKLQKTINLCVVIIRQQDVHCKNV